MIVNVQYFESLNDVVGVIIGICVWEIVFDCVFDVVDEVMFVDLLVEELFEWMCDGKVYFVQQVECVVCNFFCKGNLIVLCEFVLWCMVDCVDVQMCEYCVDCLIQCIWQVCEWLLVCVGFGFEVLMFVCVVVWFVVSLKVDWIVVYVEMLCLQWLFDVWWQCIFDVLKFVVEFGVEMVMFVGVDVVVVLIGYVKVCNVLKLVVGGLLKVGFVCCFVWLFGEQLVECVGDVDLMLICVFVSDEVCVVLFDVWVCDWCDVFVQFGMYCLLLCYYVYVVVICVVIIVVVSVVFG